MSPDGIKVAVGTGNGSVGVLDVSTHAYQSLLRSHCKDILALAGRPNPDLPYTGNRRSSAAPSLLHIRVLVSRLFFLPFDCLTRTTSMLLSTRWCFRRPCEVRVAAAIYFS